MWGVCEVEACMGWYRQDGCLACVKSAWTFILWTSIVVFGWGSQVGMFGSQVCACLWLHMFGVLSALWWPRMMVVLFTQLCGGHSGIFEQVWALIL